jgi:penicillin-binding protein 1A
MPRCDSVVKANDFGWMGTVKLTLSHVLPRVIIGLFVIIVAAFLIFVGASYIYFTHNLPGIDTLKNYKPPTITTFYSEEGEIIGEFCVEKRVVVSLDRMPPHLIQAFIAGEDAKFYSHKGLDYIAIVRALFKNLFSGEIVQGGSTITQQVVKSLLLSSEKSLARKIREALLAFKIEKNLSKDEILYLYLNQIYLGHGAYGVAAAAETYFGKKIGEMNLPEAALLAGLTQAPSKDSPFHHPEQARRRQAYVLHRMAEEGFISHAERTQAMQTPLKITGKQNLFSEKASYFVEYVRKYVEDKYGKEGLYQHGLQVYTTLDLDVQRVAQEAVESGVKAIEKRRHYPPSNPALPLEGALVCFDLETGYIKAMVGGRDFKRSQFNRVTQAKRQTGSAFKPIVYASALDKGYTPASVIVDSPITFEWGDRVWKPKNFGRRFLGPITLRSALTHSVNVVTVKIAQEIGLDTIRHYAKKLGITSPLQNNLSMALGSSNLSLYELTGAYAVLANQGKLFRPLFVKKILDRDGNLLEEHLPLYALGGAHDDEAVLSPQTAYLMTNLLEGVVQNGTGWKAKALKRPAAAKTGTTDQFVDAWFIGYTPELVTGVWVGFDDEQSLGENETGANAASPIWVAFMSKVLREKPVRDFPIPEGIEFVEIESEKGIFRECFKEGTGPAQRIPPLSKTSIDFFKLDLNLSTKSN